MSGLERRLSEVLRFAQAEARTEAAAAATLRDTNYPSDYVMRRTARANICERVVTLLQEALALTEGRP